MRVAHLYLYIGIVHHLKAFSTSDFGYLAQSDFNFSLMGLALIFFQVWAGLDFAARASNERRTIRISANPPHTGLRRNFLRSGVRSASWDLRRVSWR